MLGAPWKNDPPPLPDRRAGAADAADLQLLRQIMTGRRDAFETLYRAYFPRLARFLECMMRNSLLIEEVINDTMFVVWQRGDSFDGSCKVSTWIFGIAYRTALKALRRSDTPVEADPDALHGDAAYEPETEMARLQLQRQVSAALDCLPHEQHMTVMLTYYHGMGYDEIGDIMLCPVNTVKTRMFHARRKLRILLEEQAGPTSCMEK